MDTKETFEAIADIAKRADGMGLMHYDRMSMIMDLECANEHFGLALKELLKASDVDFAHDISGIQNHINRQTKTFDGFFVPRFAKADLAVEHSQKPKTNISVERD